MRGWLGCGWGEAVCTNTPIGTLVSGPWVCEHTEQEWSFFVGVQSLRLSDPKGCRDDEDSTCQFMYSRPHTVLVPGNLAAKDSFALLATVLPS